MSDPDRVRRGRNGILRGTSEKGWISAAVGALVLLGAHLLPATGTLSTLAVALRPAGWLALGLGLLFIAVQLASRKPAPHANTEPSAEDMDVGVTRPSVLAALGIGRGAPPAVEPNFVDTIAIHPAPEDNEDGTPGRETSWNPRVLARIDWRRFEALCQAFFAQAGFSTSAQGHGADGGVDIWLQSRHMPAPRIVRCRHWEGQPVNVKELREFLAVMSAQGLQHGTYVTSSSFAPDAGEFAKANGIQMQDGATLLKLISHRTPEQQAALLDIAYGVEETAKPE